MEEEREAFVICVGAETYLLVFVEFGKGFGVRAGFVFYEPGDAAGVGGHWFKVVFGKREGEGEKTEKMAG